MMKHLNVKRIVIACLSLLWMVMFVPCKVEARDRVDTSAVGSITIGYPVSGISFDLYRVGEIGEDGFFTFTEEYASYPLSLEIEDQSEWQALADTLAMYIEKDGLLPVQSAVTDESGNVSFVNQPVGLYLVNWKSHTVDKMRYIPQPFFVSLPNVDEEDQWVYDVKATAKYGMEELPDVIDLHVHKVWEDSKDSYELRPASIKAQLLRDGEVVDTVVLSAENNWSHDWVDLDTSHDWKVNEEEVPEEYTMTVTLEGNTVLIVNKIKPDKPETPPKTPPELPHTGTYWWAVPVLACAGLLFVLVGKLSGNKKEEQ